MRAIVFTLYRQPLEWIVLGIVLATFMWATLAWCCSGRKAWRVVNGIVWVCTILGIGFATLAARANDAQRISLVPFHTLRAAQIQPELYRSMMMNVFLFVPFGLSMPHALPPHQPHKLRTTILSALSLSVFIEACQFLFRLGLCETDDVIMNTLGTAIGCCSFCLFAIIKRNDMKKKTKSGWM